MLLLFTALIFAQAPKQEINKEWLDDSVWLLQFATVNDIIKFSKDGSFTAIVVKQGEIEEGYKGKWTISGNRLTLGFTTTPGGSTGSNLFTLHEIGKKLMIGSFTDGKAVQLVKVGLLEKNGKGGEEPTAGGKKRDSVIKRGREKKGERKRVGTR